MKKLTRDRVVERNFLYAQGNLTGIAYAEV
jgi:hypothetical protein